MLSALCIWTGFITYHNGRWVVAVLDDCSRMILAAKECDRRSVEVSIAVLEEAINRYKHIRMIREVIKSKITDHGSEFYANKRDKKRKEERSIASRSSAKPTELNISSANTTILRATAKSKSGSTPTRGSEMNLKVWKSFCTGTTT